LSRLLASIALPALDDHFTPACHWSAPLSSLPLRRLGRLVPDRQIGR